MITLIISYQSHVVLCKSDKLLIPLVKLLARYWNCEHCEADSSNHCYCLQNITLFLLCSSTITSHGGIAAALFTKVTGDVVRQLLLPYIDMVDTKPEVVCNFGTDWTIDEIPTSTPTFSTTPSSFSLPTSHDMTQHLLPNYQYVDMVISVIICVWILLILYINLMILLRKYYYFRFVVVAYLWIPVVR
jgi:hypothetical protein